MWHIIQCCGIMVNNMAIISGNKQQGMVRVGPQGRIVIPAHVRHALDILPGQLLLARAENGRLVLEKRDQILSRLQDTFTQASRGVSLVDELIAERREEARREAGE